MYAVEKLSSYITRGVYTASGPFHPFGGAVDIIVVQQQDGSFKSSPWYVRFGKFQGVLKTKEKVVKICVNGVEAGFHMYLDHKGEAYFLKDSDTGEGDFVISPPSSGDEIDEKIRSVCCNYDGGQRDLATPVETGTGKIVTRTSSRRSRIFGLMFGRRSIMENNKGAMVERVSSLEHAEIAADLLEMKWSTNLPPHERRVGSSMENPCKENDVEVNVADNEMISSHGEGMDDNFGTSIVSREHFEERTICNSSSIIADEGVLGSNTTETGDLTDRTELAIDQTTLGTDEVDIMSDESVNRSPIGYYPSPGLNTDDTSNESIGFHGNKLGDSFGTNMVTEVHFEMAVIPPTPCLGTQEEVLEIYTLETDALADRNEVLFQSVTIENDDCNVSSKGYILNNPTSDNQCHGSAAPSHDTEHSGVFSVGSGEKKVTSFTYCKTLESSTVRFDTSTDKACATLNLSAGGDGQFEKRSEVLCETTELICDICDINSRSELGGLRGEENHFGCHSKDLELCRAENSSVFQNSRDDSPSSGAFDDTVTNGFSAESPLRSCSPKLNLLSSESEVIYQDRATDELSLEIEIRMEPNEFIGNQSQMRGESTEARSHIPVSNEKSGLQSICSFRDSFNSSEQVQEVESFRKGGSMEESFLSDGVNIAQEKSGLPSSESLEDDQFQFSDIDSFVAKVTNPELPLNIIGTGTNIYHELEEIDQEKSSQSISEVSGTQTSPIAIPRSNLHLGETELLGKSLPIIRSQIHDLDRSNLFHPLSCSLDLNSEKYEHDLLRKEISSSSNLAEDSEVNVMQDNCTSEAACNAVDAENRREQKGIPINPAVELSLCKHLLFERMGTDAAWKAFNAEKVNLEKFSALGPSLVKNDRLVVRIGGHYFPWDAAAPIILGMVSFGQEHIFEPRGMIAVDQDEKNLTGDVSRVIVPSGGSWKLWPFSFKKSKTLSTVRSAPESTNRVNADSVTMRSQSLMGDRNIQEAKLMRKKVRSLTPTSEELALLNLKEGRNVITFSFSTAMLGLQKVDARIYLWKWNTRIVISDVDGTITKSDVLGQFMPMVGIDWSQTGVAHLFSAIKENGYQLLFLSARAISQAYLTRQFLFNLKQDGKALPDGPVVISPDGLFPSLYREVIRRAPHEFKIRCLEDIRAIFPPDCNPFYAGFGNRDTDEISYLKVGIPKGKIFIINPKGEVAVNRRVDTKSYTSLHALVNGMFPPISSVEQEDFNSWNYWKLPLPDVEI